MNRRRFLATLTAAAGSAGALAWRFPKGDRSSPDPEIDLIDAAGPPEGDRIGVQRLIWSVDTAEPMVALTFDDGPNPELTPKVLELLASYGIPATFHLMGYNVMQHPDVLLETVAKGHEVGNHTWTHVDLAQQTPKETKRQIAWGGEAIESVTGVRTRLFRPPRGRLSGTATRYAASMGYDVVLWSVGRGVPGRGRPKDVAAYVLDNLEPGDIVGLHDGIGREGLRTDLEGPGPVRLRRDVEIAALPQIIEGALERGFKLVTVSELVASAKPVQDG